jgi:hypothetical protein
MKKKLHILLIAALAIMASGCGKEQPHINVDPAQLEGLWQKSTSEVFWRYNGDRTGVTWDASEDITEEESNLTFNWVLSVDELTMVFSGANGNQAVPKVYTITSIGDAVMTWRDNYGMTQTFNRVVE